MVEVDVDVDVDGRGGLGNGGGGLSRPDCKIVVGFLFLRLLSTFICTKASLFEQRCVFPRKKSKNKPICLHIR